MLIMSNVRKFFSLNVRCEFTTQFPKRFKIETVDGLIEKMSLVQDEAREIENLVILDAPCSIYFQQHDFLLMINKEQFQTCSGKRSNRWAYEVVNHTKTIRSKKEQQVYRHFITRCDVEPFVRARKEKLEYSIDADFEELDEVECDKLYKKIKDGKSQRGKISRIQGQHDRSDRAYSSTPSPLSVDTQKVFENEDSLSEDEEVERSDISIDHEEEKTEVPVLWCHLSCMTEPNR